MQRQKPKLGYSGLTIVLSNPSRFDQIKLLSGTGGDLFNTFCLRPELNLMQCDVRLVEDNSPFLEKTKSVLLLGEQSSHRYLPQTRGNTIHETRGGVYQQDNLIFIPSYLPQDCADIKNYEQQFNPEAEGYDDESFEGDAEDSEDSDLKEFSKTSRKNYPFWLRADTQKAKRFLTNSSLVKGSPTYKIIPDSSEVIQILSNTENEYLYFDIETDYEQQNLLCFSFSFSSNPNTIYCVPVLDYRYDWHYQDLPRIIRALIISIRRNTLVAHNGAAFDFLVLGMKYHIPVYKVYDTMLAMRRCFPGVESSLGHCISYWTDLQFHKDTDSKQYRTFDDMTRKLQYCGKDVYGMYLIHKGIEEFSKTIPGLSSSIQCVMDSVVPYLCITLQGIRYDQKKIEEICDENDKLMMQYDRLIHLLIGEPGMEHVHTFLKGKPGLFAGSSKQCCAYFHDILDYPVMFRSPATGEPSIGKKTLYKLALKYPDNAVITFVNLYRKRQKETGTLRFNPFRDDNNKILPRIKERE